MTQCIFTLVTERSVALSLLHVTSEMNAADVFFYSGRLCCPQGVGSLGVKLATH